MLTPIQLERYAEVLLWGLKTARTEKFKKGDNVLIRYDLAALPLAEVLYPRLMEEGFNPIQRLTLTEHMEKDFYMLSDPNQLVFKAPGDQELFSALNGSISLRAPSSITHLSSIDPSKIGKVAVAKKYLSDILDVREAKGLFGWTLCMYPTEELARHASMRSGRIYGPDREGLFPRPQGPGNPLERHLQRCPGHQEMAQCHEGEVLSRRIREYRS